MKSVINKYRKFIFIYTAINCFALLVNVFNIKASTSSGKTQVYYFTHASLDEKNSVWPFTAYTQTYNEGYPSELSVFNGIFYRYDLSEFLLYMGILLGVLVYKAYVVKPVVRVKA